MKRLIFAVVCAGVLAASQAYAGSIYLAPGDYSGSRSTGGGGLIANGNQDGGGFVFEWAIDFGTTNADMWTYKYTIKRESGSLVPISHLNLETSLDFNGASIIPNENSNLPGASGNKGQPVDIFGLKFEFESSMYTLVTDRAPVWGDVFGKKGQGGFYNVGIGTDPTAQTTDFTNWVATPNSVKTPPPGTVIPSPAAAGAGLILLGLTAFRRQRA